MRFETAWEQAEVGWCRQACIDWDGRKRRIWVFVLGVRDDPGLVPDLIRKLERQAAADADLNPDARNIPGTEDRPAPPRNLPQSPAERLERGFRPLGEHPGYTRGLKRAETSR